jgi:hypothetical protein
MVSAKRITRRPSPKGARLGVFILGSAASWLGLLSVAYAVGRSQESRARLNNTHVVISIGATVVLAAVIVVRMMSIA